MFLGDLCVINNGKYDIWKISVGIGDFWKSMVICGDLCDREDGMG